MKKLIDFLGDCYLKLSLISENFFEENVKKNDTTMIIFLMIPILLIAIVLTFVNNFIPSNGKLIFITFYPLFGLILLLLTAGYYNGKRKRQALGYNFKMIKLSFSNIDFNQLRFTQSDTYNFKLLYRNRKVESKINNRVLVKNKSAASYSFLFSLFHVLHSEGIKDLNTIKRQFFFQMLEDSFSMNGDSINKDSLESSYCKWNSRLKNDENSIKDLTIIKSVFKIE